LSKLVIVILLGSLSMVGPLGIDAYLPSFHAIGAEFAVGPVVVQQTLSVYVLCFAIMMLFYGTLSDSFGRRRVILISLVLFVVASLAAALAPSIGWLIAARALQGLAAGAGVVVGRAIVQDRFSGAEAHRVMSHMTMVFGVAPVVAPIVGGWLQAWSGWRAVFVFLTVSTVLMLLACYKYLPESLPVERRQPFRLRSITANYLKILRHSRFSLMALAFGLAFSGVALYIGSAANFVMTILGLSETAFAWMFVPLIGGMMLGAVFAPRFATRMSSFALIRLGFACMLVAGMVNLAYASFFTAAVPWAVVPLAMYTFGLALAAPGMILLMLSFFPDLKGMAASVQSFIHMLTFAVIAGLIAPLLFDHAAALAAGHLVGVLLGALLWAWAGRGLGSGSGNAPDATATNRADH